MNIEVKKLSNQDINEFLELIKVFEHVFEWENFILPAQVHLQRVLENPYFVVFVAETNKKIVGGLTAHILGRYYSEKPSLYVYDLAVLNELQRKGIGKKLMATLNEYAQKNGFNEVFVQAETDDFQAVNFYRKTPVSGELQATHFYYSFDENQSGSDKN